MKYAQVLRQILVVMGLMFCGLSDGFIFGQMSGMIDGLKKKDNSIPMTDEDISWLASIINISSFSGIGLVSALSEVFGRRKSITVVTTPVLICWLMVYFAKDKYTLLASRVIIGASFGSILVLTYLSISEYVAPSARSLCLNLMSAFASSIGILMGHVLSLFLHWRTVALIGIIPTVISAILPFFWVESPYWWATKGRFQECEIAFKALRSPSKAAKIELQMLINNKYNRMSRKGNLLLLLIIKYIKTSKEKYYQRMMCLLFVVSIYRVAAGRVMFNTLIISMLQDITGTSDILIFTLLVDGLTLTGAGLSCILVSRLHMRTLLFTSGSMANIIQIIFALCLYLWPDNRLYISWIKIFLLVSYCIVVSAGLYVVLETVISELHPLDIRTLSFFVVGAVIGIMQFINIKLATSLFSSIGYHGFFFCNAIIVFICLFFLFLYLPETKGRTLQEIQLYFRDNKFIAYDEVLCSQQQKDLLNIEDSKTKHEIYSVITN